MAFLKCFKDLVVKRMRILGYFFPTGMLNEHWTVCKMWGVLRQNHVVCFFVSCFGIVVPLESKRLSGALISIHYFVLFMFKLLLCHFLVIAAALWGVYSKHANMWTNIRLQLYNEAKVLHFILVLCIFIFFPQLTNSTQVSPPNDGCVQKPLLHHVKSSR